MKYPVVEKVLYRIWDNGQRTRVPARMAIVPGRKRLVYAFADYEGTEREVVPIIFPDLLFVHNYASHMTHVFLRSRRKDHLRVPALSNVMEDGQVCLGGNATIAVARRRMTPEDAFFLTGFQDDRRAIKEGLKYCNEIPVEFALEEVFGFNFREMKGWS